MSDYILISGDTAMFKPSFGAATVVPQPGILSGTGSATVNGKAVCIQGDEANVIVPGVTYMAPPYVMPGVGELSIDSLASDQIATKTTSNGTAVLLKGGDFNAKFEVRSPAMQPTVAGPVPDSTPQYSGNGSFVTTNTKAQGT